MVPSQAPLGQAALMAAVCAALLIGASTPHPASSPNPKPTPTATPTPTPTPQESLSPDAILLRAQAVTRRHPHPQYYTYKMHEVFIHHGGRFEYDYQVWYRSDGKGLMQGLTPDKRGRRETLFQYPFPVAPDIDILLYATPAPRPTPSPVLSPTPLASGATPAPVIEQAVILGNRYYAVALAGVEQLSGHPVYHLTLHPLADERSHPLKDLWVDVNSFEVYRSHLKAGGTLGPLTGAIEATADFAPVGPYWMVTHLVADGSGHVAFISDSGHYEYAFSDFGFPASLPCWYFDPREFKSHACAGPGPASH